MLWRALGDKKLTFQELQSIMGHLNFACRVIALGRAFNAQLVVATAGIAKPHPFKQVTVEVKQDLKVWEQFWGQCNGVFMEGRMFIGDWFENPFRCFWGMGFWVFY